MFPVTISKHILKQQLGYWLNRSRQCVHTAVEARLAQYDITIASWCVLISVYDGSATSVNKLSKYIEVDKASISRVVEKLVVRGLLTHKAGPNRRSGTIALTPEGLELVPKLYSTIKENDKYFFGDISNEDKEALRRCLRSILSHSSDITLEGWVK